MIAILGAGPHGRQIASIFERITAEAQMRGVPGPGTPVLYDDNLPDYPNCCELEDVPYVIGALWPAVKFAIRANIPLGRTPLNKGNFAFPGAQIGDGVELDHHIHLLYNSVVSHGCKIGSFVTVCAGAVLAGEVTVGAGAFIGANATVLHGGITIGAEAIVGAGAVVLEDVPPGATVASPERKTLVTRAAGENRAYAELPG